MFSNNFDQDVLDYAGEIRSKVRLGEVDDDMSKLVSEALRQCHLHQKRVEAQIMQIGGTVARLFDGFVDFGLCYWFNTTGEMQGAGSQLDRLLATLHESRGTLVVAVQIHKAAEAARADYEFLAEE